MSIERPHTLAPNAVIETDVRHHRRRGMRPEHGALVLESGLILETAEHSALNAVEVTDTARTKQDRAARKIFHSALPTRWSEEEQRFGVRGDRQGKWDRPQDGAQIHRAWAGGADLWPSQTRQAVIDPFTAYLRERVTRYPGLTGSRLFRELKELGYSGGYTAVTDFLRDVRPTAAERSFEVCFETPPGEQAQVDFAQFHVVFTDEPTTPRIVWLFSLVLGFSRLIWGHFVVHQNLATVLRCHAAAFDALGGAPREVLYDRMKTAVIGEGEAGGIVYNRALVDLASHHGFHPKACRPYRAKTKARSSGRSATSARTSSWPGPFRNLDERAAAPLAGHGRKPQGSRHHKACCQRSFRRGASIAAAAAIGAVPFGLKLERRISREGMVSVGGNFYSVPDAIGSAMTLGRLPEEALGRRQIPMLTEPELDRIADAVDGAVEVHPMSADLDVGLINMLFARHFALAPVETLQQQGREVNNPAMDRRLIDADVRGHCQTTRNQKVCNRTSTYATLQSFLDLDREF